VSRVNILLNANRYCPSSKNQPSRSNPITLTTPMRYCFSSSRRSVSEILCNLLLISVFGTAVKSRNPFAAHLSFRASMPARIFEMLKISPSCNGISVRSSPGENAWASIKVKSPELPSMTNGGKGVMTPGCPACRKRLYTMGNFMDHLADDVLPSKGSANYSGSKHM
jgi:hypothetical protein